MEFRKAADDRETGVTRARPWLAISAVAVSLVIAAPGAPRAHLNQPDQGDPTIVHACVKKTGVVRVIDGATKDCLKTETRTHWDLIGEQGAQGAQGDTGLAGEPSIGILGGSTGSALLPGGSDQFVGIFNAGRSRIEGEVQLPIPAGGTLANFYVLLSGPPGAGKTWTFVVRSNGADTPVTCTVQDQATSCADLTNTSAFDGGDLLSIRVIGGGNPVTRLVQWTGLYQPD
jgi:hypothetical protein